MTPLERLQQIIHQLKDSRLSLPDAALDFLPSDILNELHNIFNTNQIVLQLQKDALVGQDYTLYIDSIDYGGFQWKSACQNGLSSSTILFKGDQQGNILDIKIDLALSDDAASLKIKDFIRLIMNIVPEDSRYFNKVLDMMALRLGMEFSFSLSGGFDHWAFSGKVNFGGKDFEVKLLKGKKATAFGLFIPELFDPGDLADALEILNGVHFTQSALIFANADDPDFKIEYVTGVVKGAELKTTFNLQESSSSDIALKALIGSLAQMFESPIDITLSVNQTDIKLQVGLTGAYSLPTPLEKLGVSDIVFETDLTYSPSMIFAADVSGNCSLPVDLRCDPPKNPLVVNGKLGFSVKLQSTDVTLSATLHSDQSYQNPFGIKGLTVKNLGAGLLGELNKSGESFGISLQGGIELGDIKFQEQGAIILELTDGEIPNPVLLSCATDNLNLQQIFSALFPDRPAVLDKMTDFTIEHMEFFWCEPGGGDRTLPDGTKCSPGIGFNAAMNYWGFHTFGALKIDLQNTANISGKCCVDPISFSKNGTEFVSIKGDGPGIDKPSYSHVKPGGPSFSLDTEKKEFEVDCNASIMGISEVMRASVSKDLLNIHLKSNLGFLSDELDVHLSKKDEKLTLSCHINAGLNVAPTIKVGNYKLGVLHLENCGFEGSLEATASPENLEWMVEGKIHWNNTSIDFPKIDVHTYGNHFNLDGLIDAIQGTILEKASELWSKYFKDVMHYLDAVVHNLLKEGDFVINVLYHVFDNENFADLIRDVAKIQNGYHIDGKIDFDLDYGLNIPDQTVHADWGHVDFSHVDTPRWDPLHIDEGVGIHADLLSFTVPGVKVPLIKMDVNEHLDQIAPPQVHADATSPKVSPSPLKWDLKLVKGEASAYAQLKINKSVALTIPKLTDIKGGLHADGNVYIDIHGDLFKVVDDTRDSHAHLDVDL